MSVAEIMALTGFASRYSFYKYVVHAGADALSTDKKGKRPKKTEGRGNEGRELHLSSFYHGAQKMGQMTLSHAGIPDLRKNLPG